MGTVCKIDYHHIVEIGDAIVPSPLQIHVANSSGKTEHSEGLQLAFL